MPAVSVLQQGDRHGTIGVVADTSSDSRLLTCFSGNLLILSRADQRGTMLVRREATADVGFINPVLTGKESSLREDVTLCQIATLGNGVTVARLTLDQL